MAISAIAVYHNQPPFETPARVTRYAAEFPESESLDSVIAYFEQISTPDNYNQKNDIISIEIRRVA